MMTQEAQKKHKRDLIAAGTELTWWLDSQRQRTGVSILYKHLKGRDCLLIDYRMKSFGFQERNWRGKTVDVIAV